MKIAHTLLIHGARAAEMSQEELWSLVRGLNGRVPTKNTCSTAVDAMIKRGHFLEKRPVRFGPGMGYVLAISVGSESLRATLVDANGAIVPVADAPAASSGQEPELHAAEGEPAPLQLRMSRARLLDRIVDLATSVLIRALHDEPVLLECRLPLLGVVVAWPSPINRWTKLPTGRTLSDDSWRNIDRNGNPAVGLDRLIADRFKIEPSRGHALNDANAVAIAAAFDRCRRRSEHGDGRLGGAIIALRIGGGLGAGTVIVGRSIQGRPRSPFLSARLLEGAGGYAGELGHWQVPQQDLDEVFGSSEEELVALGVRRCTCGRQRCLELFASASAFAERMHRSGIGVEGLKPGEARGITSVMHEVMRNVADTRQIGAQKDVGRLIARSLSAPVLMLNPESVTLSGSLAVPAVRSGIEEEKARWRHVHDDELSLHLLEGVQNKYAAARGAALGVFRGQLYRRFDDQTLDFHRLTLGVDRARVDSWATHSQFQRRPRQVQIQSETGPRRS